MTLFVRKSGNRGQLLSKIASLDISTRPPKKCGRAVGQAGYGTLVPPS